MLPFNQRSLCALCAMIVLAVTGSAASAQTRFEENFDDATMPWQEIAVQLPAAPETENLLPFSLSVDSPYTFAVDAKSLSVGEDGVIRYTLVATSDAGARNVSYEGIRCASFERKLYAFGQPDGSWSRSRRDQWERMKNTASNYAAVLAKDYLCQNLTIAGTAEEMISRLRHRRPLSASVYR